MADLTNVQLRNELINLGFKPGPITDSTRPVFVRKLESLRKQETQSSGNERKRSTKTVAAQDHIANKESKSERRILPSTVARRTRSAVFDKQLANNDDDNISHATDSDNSSVVDIGKSRSSPRRSKHTGEAQRFSPKKDLSENFDTGNDIIPGERNIPSKSVGPSSSSFDVSPKVNVFSRITSSFSSGSTGDKSSPNKSIFRNEYSSRNESFNDNPRLKTFSSSIYDKMPAATTGLTPRSSILRSLYEAKSSPRAAEVTTRPGLLSHSIDDKKYKTSFEISDESANDDEDEDDEQAGEDYKVEHVDRSMNTTKNIGGYSFVSPTSLASNRFASTFTSTPFQYPSRFTTPEDVAVRRTDRRALNDKYSTSYNYGSPAVKDRSPYTDKLMTSFSKWTKQLCDQWKQLVSGRKSRSDAHLPTDRLSRYSNSIYNSRTPKSWLNGFSSSGLSGADESYVKFGVENKFKTGWRLSDSGGAVIFYILLFIVFLVFIVYCVLVHSENALRITQIVIDAASDTVYDIYAKFFLPLLFVSVVVSLLLAMYYLHYNQQQKRLMFDRQVHEMVQKIVETVRNNHQISIERGNENPSIPVPHVRDALIPVDQRNQQASIWKAAVKYLDDHESRIRQEVQCVHGEEWPVWRWLQKEDITSDMSRSGNLHSSAWQGCAISDDQIPLNAPARPYTECLKARGLFAAEHSKTIDGRLVERSILSKVGPKARIVHIAIDRYSDEGVVYIKCASLNDAGHVYKALHGQWFNGKLVTVKYLRPERYHDRFPDSANATIPISISSY